MKYCSTQTGFSAQVGDGVIAQELDGGAPRYRRAVRGTYHLASVEWVVQEAGFQYLMAFYRVWSRNPSQPFLAKLCIDNAPVENYQCHFDGAPSINRKESDVFIVSASLRVKPLTINSTMDDTIVGAANYEDDLALLGNMLEELVNEDLPDALWNIPQEEIVKPLFSNGEQGFFYDPNDLSTMFQGSVGTVPVTGAGQPVGLMLDKSKGLELGDELFVNPTLTGQWVSDGNNVYTCTNSIELSDLIINTGTAGKFYVVEFEVIENSLAVVAYTFVGAPTTITTTGVFKYIRLATTSQFMLRVGAGRSAKIRLISAKELKGNHAYQTTSSMRPLLVASPQRLDYDTVDDKLVTTLPAQLTGCTVIRSVPNVGTQILTGQTIPASYNDNTDHCGLIAINRALTANETSAITDVFNKRAGV